MLNKILAISLCATISSSIFASEEVVFKCDTTPKGSIKVIRNNTLYKVNIIKNGKNILNFSKDYKKNTKNNFIKFDYSSGSLDSISAIGITIGYLGSKNNSLHTIISDEYTTHSVGYSIDNNNILECINNENYINNFKKLDRERKLPPFYYD